MDRTLLERVISAIEPHILSRLSALEFEMAYQVRIAIDRIRFALKNTDQLSINSDQIREANLQLLDALDRLESADRHFQERFRTGGSSSSELFIESIKNGCARTAKQR